MKDAAELCRGLLRKARSDRIAMDASLAAQAFDGNENCGLNRFCLSLPSCLRGILESFIDG